MSHLYHPFSTRSATTRLSMRQRFTHFFLKVYPSLATGGQSVYNHRLRPQLVQLAAAGQAVYNHSCIHQVLN